MSNDKIRQVAQFLNNATSSYDLTVSGFGDVKGAILIASSGTVNTVTDDVMYGIGFWSDNGEIIDQLGVGISSEHGVGTSSCHRSYSFAGIYVPDVGGGMRAHWTCSAITDGIRLTKGVNNTGSVTVTAILFGGDGIEDTWVTAMDSSTSSTTALGFKPDLVVSAHSGLAGIGNAGTSDDYSLGFGVAANHQGREIRQWCTTIGESDGVGTMRVAGRSRDTHIADYFTGLNTSQRRMAVTSFDATGLSWTTSGTGTHFIAPFLALKLTKPESLYVSGSSLTASSSSWNSGATIRPFEAFLGSGIHGVPTNSTGYNSNIGGWFLHSFANEVDRTNAFSVEDGVGTSVTKTYRSSDGNLGHLDDDGTLFTGSISFNDTTRWVDVSYDTTAPTNGAYMNYIIFEETEPTIALGSDSVDFTNIVMADDTNRVKRIYKGTVPLW